MAPMRTFVGADKMPRSQKMKKGTAIKAFLEPLLQIEVFGGEEIMWAVYREEEEERCG